MHLIDSIESSCRNAGLTAYEICISDNNSTDETQSRIRSLSNTKLRYIRQTKNEGPQLNIALVISMATGTHTWLLGDDDALTDDAVSTILNEIRIFQETDLFLVNRIECDANLIPKRHDSYTKSKHSQNIIIDGSSQAVAYVEDCETVDGLGCFISSWVIKNATAKDMFREYNQEYSRNLFPHVYQLWKYASQRDAVRLRYVQDRLVKWRGDNSSAARGLPSRAMDLDITFKASWLDAKVSNAARRLIQHQYKASLTAESLCRSKLTTSELSYILSTFHHQPAQIVVLVSVGVKILGLRIRGRNLFPWNVRTKLTRALIRRGTKDYVAVP